MSAVPEPSLVVGTVRRPHGVRGELQVSLDTDRPDEIFQPGRELALGDAAGAATGEGVVVEKVRPFKGGVLLQLEGCADRDAADLMRGRTLLIRASEAAGSDDDEAHYSELIGSAVVVADEVIGTVTDIIEAGGGQLLAVRRSGAPEVLIPYVREIVIAFDREKRQVVIAPPPGLMEL
jgi:16S rRNA processing protein RimM